MQRLREAGVAQRGAVGQKRVLQERPQPRERDAPRRARQRRRRVGAVAERGGNGVHCGRRRRARERAERPGERVRGPRPVPFPKVELGRPAYGRGDHQADAAHERGGDVRVRLRRGCIRRDAGTEGVRPRRARRALRHGRGARGERGDELADHRVGVHGAREDERGRRARDLVHRRARHAHQASAQDVQGARVRAPDEDPDHAAHRDARDRRLHHAIDMREERGDLPLRAASHHGALPGTPAPRLCVVVARLRCLLFLRF